MIDSSDLIEVGLELLDSYHEQAVEEKEKARIIAENPPIEVEPVEKPKKERANRRRDITIKIKEREPQIQADHPSILSPEDALVAVGLDLEGDYFSIEAGDLRVNAEKFNEAYETSKSLFLNWSKSAIQSSDGINYSPPSEITTRAVNDIAFGIRAFDYGIYMKFMEFV